MNVLEQISNFFEKLKQNVNTLFATTKETKTKTTTTLIFKDFYNLNGGR